MRLKTIRNAKIKPSVRVLVREDYNVPIGQDGRVDRTEDWRIIKSLPTLKYLLAKKARIIILAHLGRPGGKRIKKLSLQPVATRLGQLLPKKIKFCTSWKDEMIRQQINELKNGEILMLENIRFNPGEESNDQKFTRQLAGYGDIYVNDAFANSHRSHASMVAITKYLPSYAGLLLATEVNEISRILKKPTRPFIGIMGGIKISTKLKLIQTFLRKVDYLLLAGGLANTILKARGLSIGKSAYEQKMVRIAKNLKSKKIILPVDIVVCRGFKDQKCRVVKSDEVQRSEKILDIGPGTGELYEQILSGVKTIFWNGPLGFIEEKKFKKGTFSLLNILKKSQAEIIIGGGETVEALLEYDQKLPNRKNIFVSTGGGAMLELIEKGELPALKPLIQG